MVAMNMGWGISVQKQGWRKGPWTPEEDKLLSEYVNLHGEGRWSSVARCAGLNRSGKSCRLRWVNYLRPGLKRGQITPQEEGIIIELHALWGNKWSTIAKYLPGRTDNEIKNFWRTHFKKKEKSSLKQQKRRSQLLKEKLGQKDDQQLQENNTKSTTSTVLETSEQKIMNIDHDHQSQETTATKHTDHTVFWDPTSGQNNTFNGLDQVQCLPVMYQDLVSYSWSDVVTLDQECVLWGGLWNLGDQSYGRTENANQGDNMMNKLATSHQNINNNQLPTGANYHGVLGDNYCSNKNNNIIPIQNQARAFSSCTEGSYIF